MTHYRPLKPLQLTMYMPFTCGKYEVKHCAELICKLAGVRMCSTTVAQLMLSSVSSQDSHSSVQGGHLLFFWFGLSENKLLPASSSSSSEEERNTWHCSLKG